MEKPRSRILISLHFDYLDGRIRTTSAYVRKWNERPIIPPGFIRFFLIKFPRGGAKAVIKDSASAPACLEAAALGRIRSDYRYNRASRCFASGSVIPIRQEYPSTSKWATLAWSVPKREQAIVWAEMVLANLELVPPA
jgi:hypothetical protein